MNRVEIKRGSTTIRVPERNLDYYEARGYKKVTTTTTASRGRKAAAKNEE